MDEMGELPGKFQLHRPLKVYLTVYTNAFSERWIRSAREECLDLILIINAAHLRRVVIEYVDYYNTARPHQGIDQQIPIPQARPSSGTIQCRNVLGGIIYDYYRAPTPLALPAT